VRKYKYNTVSKNKKEMRNSTQSKLRNSGSLSVYDKTSCIANRARQ